MQKVGGIELAVEGVRNLFRVWDRMPNDGVIPIVLTVRSAAGLPDLPGQHRMPGRGTAHPAR